MEPSRVGNRIGSGCREISLVDRGGVARLDHLDVTGLGVETDHRGSRRRRAAQKIDAAARTAVHRSPTDMRRERRVECLQRRGSGAVETAWWEYPEVVAPVLRIRADHRAVRQERVAAQAEHPLRGPELRLSRAEWQHLVTMYGIQVPPTGPVRDEVQTASRAPLWLEHRLAGSPSDPAGLCQPVLRVEVRHPELGAVPGHLRMAPFEPGQTGAVGVESGTGVKVVVRRQ